MHFFGFQNLREFIATIFGSSSFAVKLYAAMLIGAASFVGAIEHYVWSPAWTLAFYMAVLIADFVTGTLIGMRREGFQTSKAQRLPAILAVHLFLLGFFYNLPKLNEAVGIKGIDFLLALPTRSFYWYVLLVNLASFVRNASALGWIKGAIAKWVISNIDKQKAKL